MASEHYLDHYVQTDYGHLRLRYVPGEYYVCTENLLADDYRIVFIKGQSYRCLDIGKDASSVTLSSEIASESVIRGEWLNFFVKPTCMREYAVRWKAPPRRVQHRLLHEERKAARRHSKRLGN